MKKIILIIVLMFVVGCNNDIIEPIENTEIIISYQIEGCLNPVDYYCVYGTPQSIRCFTNITLYSYFTSFVQTTNETNYCSLSSLNLYESTGLVLKLFYNGMEIDRSSPTNGSTIISVQYP